MKSMMTRAPYLSSPWYVALLVASFALLGSSCALYEELEPLDRAAAIKTIEISPDPARIEIFKNAQFTARLYDHADQEIRNIPVEWSSADPSIVAIDKNGLASAKAIGDAHITAQAGPAQTTIKVTVYAAIKRIEVHPSTLTLSVDEREQLTAQVYGADDELLSARQVDWSSTDEAIVTVDSEGQITGVSEGTATIRARAAGVTGTAQVSVEKPVDHIKLDPTQAIIDVSETLEIDAQVYDIAGETSPDRVVTWTSSRPEVASVSTTGAVTGLKEGSTRITAQSGGKSAEARIDVEASTKAVLISPNPASVALDEELQLNARALDAAENVLTGRTFTWESADETIATVNDTGLVTGLIEGRVTITATHDDVTGSMRLDVLNPVDSIELSPDPVTLELDATRQLTATLKNHRGDLLEDRSITWRSDNPAIAEVDSQGLVTARRPGTTEVTATSEGVSASTTVIVQNTVAIVEVSPASPTIQVTESLPLSAVAKNSLGEIIPDKIAIWSSDDSAIAQVDADGIVEGRRGGTTTIKAQIDNIVGQAQVTIKAPVRSITISPDPAMVGVGSTLPLTAVLRDQAQNELSGRQIAWSSANEAVATVDPSGLVQGIALGQTTITATSEGISATVSLAVTNPVATVNISPSSLTMTVGGTQQLDVELLNSQGDPLTAGRHVQWSSDDETVATVSSSGVITAHKVGATTIRATSEGITGLMQLAVQNRIHTVEITPADHTLEVSESVQLNAVAKNELGGEVPDAVFTWSSSNSSVAPVNSAGLVTAKTGGSATITARADNIEGIASITVENPVRSITIAPKNTTLEITKTATLNATLKDKAGNTITGRTIQWTSGNPAIASVNSSGKVTANAQGTTTITASVDQASASANITVEAPPRTLEITPSNLAIHVGGVQTLTAIAKDLAGNSLSGTTATWTSANPNIATATSSGAMTAQISGQAGGDTTITASISDGKGGNITKAVPVTVTASVASIELYPEKVGLFPGDQAQLNATLRDANNNVLTGLAISWTTADSSIATVNSSGLVSALSHGQTQITAAVGNISGSAQVDVVKWHHISVNHSHSCGTLTNGEGFCWGRNSDDGILGNGTVDSGTGPDGFSDDANAHVPTAISGDLEFEMVTIGIFHACGLTNQGKAYCWGAGGGGHLGQGTNTSSPVPVAVSGNYTFTDIQLGANHTCALDTAQRIYCWGANLAGQLGQGEGSSNFSSVPQRVQGHQFTAMAVGTNHTCGIRTDGTTLCWGNNTYGQLGDGSTSESRAPVEVDTTQTFVTIASKYTHTCGLTAAGKAYCWGDNDNGALGDGTGATHRPTPVAAASNYNFKKITTGTNTTCGITNDKDAYCWGFNGQGNLGIGSPTGEERSPVLVSGGYQWESLSLGLQHTCGIASGYDTAFCWGDNDHGQLGNGTPNNYIAVPIPAVNP